MLSALKFVQGAVSRKDFQPALAHFRIKDGRVTGYNGTIALSSPIGIDLAATPRAVPFVKAIERCTDTTALHITPGGKLGLRSGKFKAFIECTDESDILDGIVPSGSPIHVPAFIGALRSLEPFIGTDASRPWATGILFRGFSAYATNNVIVAEYWLGQPVPEINLPSAAIDELLRIKEEPIAVWMAENHVTFFFSGDRWMRTQLLNLDWPQLETFLSVQGDLQLVPEGFFKAVESLIPFYEENGHVFFRQGRIQTSPHEGIGASIEITGLPDSGAYHYKHLLALQGVVTEINFTNKPPLPSPFRGEMLRGVILGMHDL